MALTDKLDAIADSIRAKTGKTALMTLDEMPAEIASIKSGGGSGGEVVQHVGSYDYSITTASKKTSSSAATSGTTMTATKKLLFADYGIKPDLSNLVAIVAEVGTFQISQYISNSTTYYSTSSYTYTPRLAPNENGNFDIYFRWYDENSNPETNASGNIYFKIDTLDEEGLSLKFYYGWGLNSANVRSSSPVGFKYVYVITKEASAE